MLATEEEKRPTSPLWWQETRGKGNLGLLEIKPWKCLSLHPSACTGMRRQSWEWLQSAREQKQAFPSSVPPCQHQQHPPTIPSQVVGGIWGIPMPPMSCSFLVKLPPCRYLPAFIVHGGVWLKVNSRRRMSPYLDTRVMVNMTQDCDCSLCYSLTALILCKMHSCFFLHLSAFDTWPGKKHLMAILQPPP